MSTTSKQISLGTLQTVPEEEAKGAGKGKKTSAAEEQPVDDEGSPPVHRLLQDILFIPSLLKRELIH